MARGVTRSDNEDSSAARNVDPDGPLAWGLLGEAHDAREKTMPPMLSFGSVGADVRDLQRYLNVLPSELPSLAVDGIFGSKTKARTQEFQSDSDLDPDGVVGPWTWDSLLQSIQQAIGVTTFQQRKAIVKTAEDEANAGGVFAKVGAGLDPTDIQGRQFRWGCDKLLKYFRVAAPDPKNANQTFYNEDDIIHLIVPGQLEPMRHWCGIFALWAIKTAVPARIVGTWKDGSGIGSVLGVHNVSQPDLGDVGFVSVPFQHHFIIREAPFQEEGVTKVRTVEGNSSPDSRFSFKTRAIKEISAFYSIF